MLNKIIKIDNEMEKISEIMSQLRDNLKYEELQFNNLKEERASLVNNHFKIGEYYIETLVLYTQYHYIYEITDDYIKTQTIIEFMNKDVYKLEITSEYKEPASQHYKKVDKSLYDEKLEEFKKKWENNG